MRITQEGEVVAASLVMIAIATRVQGVIILILTRSIPPVPTPWVAQAVHRGARRHTLQAILVTSDLIITIITYHCSPITVIITRTIMVLLLHAMVLPAGMMMATLLIHEALIRHYPRNHSEAWKTSKSLCKVFFTAQASRGNGD